MRRPLLIVAALFALLTLVGCSSDPEQAQQENKQQIKAQTLHLAFGGGPTGGTFNFFANKISSLISVRYAWLDVSPRGSGGSAENLRNLNKNGVDFGIVYSGDAFLGRNGMLPNDATRYDNVRALAFLYGAPAQLVVRADSDITSAQHLKGKRVAIGNPGSGAALSAERFFKHLGIWGDMEIRKQGYSRAAAEFSAGSIDAFWVLVGYPNSSIIEAANNVPIRLINLHDDASKSGFYDTYPFYSKVVIPATTYQGLPRSVTTFQDAALWCASNPVSIDAVYDSMNAVFSKKGLGAMVAAHKAAINMSVDNGLHGVSIPLHPGAARFWKEKGVDIPSKLLP